MRIKVSGLIIEDNQIDNSTRFNHEMYSMILKNLNEKRAEKLHKKERFKRLFTFTTLYRSDNQVHFYMSGEDKLIKDFINNIIKNQIITIGRIVINITNITDISDKIENSEVYKFKTNFIVNDMKDGKVHLSEDMGYIKMRIVKILNDKYEKLYGVNINGKLDIEFQDIKKVYTKYKNHHNNAYKVIVNMRGSNELINLMYNVGMGENTSSGHGFCWRI